MKAKLRSASTRARDLFLVVCEQVAFRSRSGFGHRDLQVVDGPGSQPSRAGWTTRRGARGRVLCPPSLTVARFSGLRGLLSPPLRAVVLTAYRRFWRSYKLVNVGPGRHSLCTLSMLMCLFYVLATST